MRILALDLGRSTGWAITNGAGRLTASGVWNLEGEGTAQPVMHLRENINYLVDPSEPFDLIAAEAPNIMPSQSMESRRMAFGLSVMAEILSVEWGVQLKLVSTQSLKATAAGILGEKVERKGKAQRIRAARSVLGRKPATDDEADAVLCGLWASRQVVVKGSEL